ALYRRHRSGDLEVLLYTHILSDGMVTQQVALDNTRTPIAGSLVIIMWSGTPRPYG
ncbi:hypothetical protein B0J17DRAFT_639737, partial [Rhizoctonia solani]